MARRLAHDALAMISYDERPAVLALADSDAGRARAARAVAAAGCRLCELAPLDGAAERLARQVAVDAVLVDAERDGGPVFDRLLDRLELGAESDRFGSVIAAPPALIDAVAARTAHGRIHHLCDPGDLDLVAALALAAARPPVRLHDARRRPAAGQLQQLSEEVGRIASVLAALSGQPAGVRTVGPATGRQAEHHEGADAGPDAGEVRAIIRARRLRDQYFDAALFADPAWDMLLDLYAARLEGTRVAVSSLCIAAAVPPTTALRWIKTLTDAGLFVRIADPEDGRRVYLELSDAAAAALDSCLRAALRVSPLLI